MAEASTSANGATSTYITLLSQEGFKILLPRSAASGSKFMRAILDDPDWQESKTGIIELPTISTPILELVAEYLIYKEKYTADNAPTGSQVPNFQARIPPESALELLMAADYLEA